MPKMIQIAKSIWLSQCRHTGDSESADGSTMITANIKERAIIGFSAFFSQ
jgi:hypothetical protein